MAQEERGDKTPTQGCKYCFNLHHDKSSNSHSCRGCDVPTLLYSFSFNQNPNWSKELCEGPEILECEFDSILPLKYKPTEIIGLDMEDTVDKFDLRKHMQFGVECTSASWNSQGFWEINLVDTKTQVKYTRTPLYSYLQSVVSLSLGRSNLLEWRNLVVRFFHTARWNHHFDYSGKRLAVIGNGCSAAQVVPAISQKAGYVKQYARSAQWYHERPNRPFTSFEKWCLGNIPLWERYLRLRLFLTSDSLVATYLPGPAAEKVRAKAESGARQYIYQTAPKEYHKFLVPDFPLGCKRRIFDPNYLESLHRSNVELAPVGIDHIDETGITGTDGVRTEFDAIMLATGFDVQKFIVPMEVYGKDGKALSQQWLESRGAQAYMGVYVHNFPNFGLLFGPNTFPAHNSVLFASEVQVEYLARTLLAPIIDHRISSLEVKSTSENQWVNALQTELKGSVFEAGCSNWYINPHGRNSASWPGYASTYWKETLKPQVGVFNRVYRSKFWIGNTVWRWIRTTKKESYFMLLLSLAGFMWHRKSVSAHQLPFIYRKIVS
ncbi:unnamed protein product [Penicillium salamii]|nr:unnamed protein product [Penicillium salamii]CAG8260856.1 unnamed protein product [Penicillium salamii]CAG8275764.1 unnamed protein product [Penicillium salamii]CAG8321306.1 unnamed protein product [Penicillium salamii]CAG8429969.1 unnamed protein product [Penicillium salamii]